MSDMSGTRRLQILSQIRLVEVALKSLDAKLAIFEATKRLMTDALTEYKHMAAEKDYHSEKLGVIKEELELYVRLSNESAEALVKETRSNVTETSSKTE
jgi:hypothetical protein